MTRDVTVFGDLSDAAKNDLVHLLRLDAGPLDGSLDRDRAEIGGGQIRIRPLKLTDRGTSAADDDDVFHEDTSSRGRLDVTGDDE